MDLELSELIVEATAYKLKAGMPARVAAINAAKGPASGISDIVISAPGDADYILFGSDGIPRFPSLIVTHGPQGIPEFTEEGPHSFGYTAQIVVGVIDADQNRQRLGYKLLRQTRAVCEVLWDDDPKEALANPYGGRAAAHTIRFEILRPGPAFDYDQKRSLWQDTYEIVFRAHRVEE